MNYFISMKMKRPINSLSPLARLSLLLVGALLMTACGKATPKLPAIPKVNRVSVVSQAVKDSKKIVQTLHYPALVVAKQQANILAKASGTANTLFFSLGDRVKVGDMLLKIDDVSGTSYGTGFNVGAVNQAKLVSDQASINYQSAQSTYQNLLASTQKDLNQTDIGLSLAEASKNNAQAIADNNLKTAQIAYGTAKVSLEQAKQALDNKTTATHQATSDTYTNATLAVTSVQNLSNSIIDGINLLTGFDESNVVNVPYKTYLSAFNSILLNDTKNLYKETKGFYESFLIRDFVDVPERVQASIVLGEKIKSLVDSVKLVLDNTITGALLPQNSGAGMSLTTLQSTITTYQNQINSALTQLHATSQALANTELNNKSGLESLQKAYELAQQQEKSASQNLENLKANSKNQLDQAGFGQEQASNLYDNTKIKLNSQLLTAKAQLDNAQLQYQNSLIALNNLTSNYQLLSPINGVVTQKLISQGETINPGQLLFVISDPTSVKIQFYVDAIVLPSLSISMPLTFQNADGQPFNAKITALSSTADANTKRYLVEAEPDNYNLGFSPGSITNVSLMVEATPEDNSNILLPISAVGVSPNGSSIFVDDGGRAKQVEVTIVQIKGEAVELKTTLLPEALVIVDGNKLLHEGDYLMEGVK